MYILQLKYENGRVEYREYADFYDLETIMTDIDQELNIYADIVSVKAFKVLEGIDLEIEGNGYRLRQMAEQMQF